MQRMNPQVAEYSIQRNYLDLFLDLPWNAFSEDQFDLKRAKQILDRDHFGLDDVKKRIISIVFRFARQWYSSSELEEPTRLTKPSFDIARLRAARLAAEMRAQVGEAW